MKLKLSKDNIWILCYLLLVIQGTLQSYFIEILGVSGITYLDEVVVMLLLICLMVYVITKRIKLNQYGKKIVLYFALFEILGIVYGVLSDYQSIGGVLLDAFTCSKFLIVFFAAWLLSRNKISDRWTLKLNNFAKIVTVVIFILSIHDFLFSPFFEKSEFRYFTYSIKLFFTHPEGLARFCMALIYPLAYNMKYKKKNMPFILMNVFVIILTLRVKSIAAVLVFMLFYAYHNYWKGKNVYPLFAAMGGISVLIGYDQIKYYYSMPEIARTKLLTDSISIANRMFPFGSGFGSFGSNVALDFNSSLYQSMGYFNALNPWANKNHLNDAFWPIVIAQTGWIGFLFFVLAIKNLLMIGISRYRDNFYFSWIFISVIVYDLISTLASSAFFHPLALSSYLFIGLLIASDRGEQTR